MMTYKIFVYYPPMDLTIILKAKKINIIKNTRRTIDKLFLLHKQNKIKDFNDKLDKLKELVNNNISEIKKLDYQIKLRENYDPIIFAIVEYFNCNRCYNSAMLLSKKYNQESDIDFFKEQDLLREDFRNKKFENLLNYIREYKNIFKMYELEEIVKINHFLNLCIKKDEKECLQFLKKNNIPRKYLINIVCLKDSINEDETPLEILLDAFGISNSRIRHRVEYGIMSYKTKMCCKYIDDECPSCMFVGLRREVPCNKREHSIILCKGTKQEITENNRGVVYDNGNVYGESYVKEKNYLLEDNKYPRQCFFM